LTERRETGKELRMREPHGEGLANHTGPESCVVVREDISEALTGEHAGRVLSRESFKLWGADLVVNWGRQHGRTRDGECSTRPCVVVDPWHVWKLPAREPGDPSTVRRRSLDRIGKAEAERR
jgi:hypothetical protein